MALPSEIRPSVGDELITKVSRLFNGTITDVLNELFQNARRAGAGRIEVHVRDHEGGSSLHIADDGRGVDDPASFVTLGRSEEHTSELQSLMRSSYAVLCLKKKKL